MLSKTIIKSSALSSSFCPLLNFCANKIIYSSRFSAFSVKQKVYFSSLPSSFSSFSPLRGFSVLSKNSERKKEENTPGDKASEQKKSAEIFNTWNKKLDEKCKVIAEATKDALHFMNSENISSTTVVQKEKKGREEALNEEKMDILQKKEENIISEAEAAEKLSKLNDTQVILASFSHPIWSQDTLVSVQVTHHKPSSISDYLAYCSVKVLRAVFDVCSGYSFGRVDERKWLNRIVFLETVAGVPGMVGAMIRHLNSLRKMQRDYGWIHTLLEEAENERMHLMVALVLKKPSAIFRAGVLITQAFFLSAFSISYLISPKFAHRFVGYLEEEAVITYSKLLSELDKGNLPLFQHLPSPPLARDYWRLHEKSTMKDVILAIRADESHHREVNHNLATLGANDVNPYAVKQSDY